MDGPSVNWKFLEHLNESRDHHKEGSHLLELGSCGLHVVHGPLQSGHSAAGWKVNSVLRSMYNVFKDHCQRLQPDDLISLHSLEITSFQRCFVRSGGLRT